MASSFFILKELHLSQLIEHLPHPLVFLLHVHQNLPTIMNTVLGGHEIPNESYPKAGKLSKAIC